MSLVSNNYAGCIYSHFSVTAEKMAKNRENVRIRVSRSLTVIELATNEKPICDFLLVITSN